MAAPEALTGLLTCTWKQVQLVRITCLWLRKMLYVVTCLKPRIVCKLTVSHRSGTVWCVAWRQECATIFGSVGKIKYNMRIIKLFFLSINFSWESVLHLKQKFMFKVVHYIYYRDIIKKKKAASQNIFSICLQKNSKQINNFILNLAIIKFKPITIYCCYHYYPSCF